MRIGGLASGMDTDQIIRDLMRAERMPVDKLNQNKQTIEWQRDSFRELNTLMTKFRDSIFDTVMRSSNMSAKKVTSSNSSLVTATATANAGNGSFNISKVKQLAQAATTVSNSSLSSSEKIDPTKSIVSQNYAGSVDWKEGVIRTENISVTEAKDTFELREKNFVTDGSLEDTISVKVNGKAFQVTTNKEELGEGKVFFDQTSGELIFNEALAKGSQLSTTYVTESRDHTFKGDAERPRKEFSLPNGAIAANDHLKINVGTEEYTLANEKIVTDKAQLEEGKVFLDTTTGRIEFHSDVTKDVTVTYGQQYMTSSMTTSQANGPVEDKFFIAGDRTLNQAIEQVNNSRVGVSVFYDEFSDRVTMMRKDTGKFNENGDEIQFKGDFFTNVLQLNHLDFDVQGEELILTNSDGTLANYQIFNENGEEVTDGSFPLEGSFENYSIVVAGKTVAKTGYDRQLQVQGSQGAQNAQFTINGLDTERHSNQFSMNGVTFTLHDTFESTSVNLNINTDSDKIFDTIVGFVNEYNEMIDTINGKLTEDRHRDYKPLTDEQREAMSEKDIERWEELAMSGMLRGDRTLSAGLDRLRVDIYSPVTTFSDSNIRQLTDLGITTTRNFMDRGKLEIDESKLRAAIENDPEGAFNLFTADGPTNAEQGIARRMRDSLQDTMRSVAERAGGSFGKLQNHQFTLGRNLNDIDSRISNFERRLQQVEDRYWKQFTAMEKAMQQANSQADQMFSMLFGNQG